MRVNIGEVINEVKNQYWCPRNPAPEPPPEPPGTLPEPVA